MEHTEKQHQPKWQIPFFTIWTGQAFSLLGSRIVQFALVWWLTELTGSATVLATATMVALIPEVLLSPIAGAYDELRIYDYPLGPTAVQRTFAAGPARLPVAGPRGE